MELMGYDFSLPLMRQSQHLLPEVHLLNSSEVSIDPIGKTVIWNSECFWRKRDSY